MATIDNLLKAFEKGDVYGMDKLITNDFNLKIEHYFADDMDVSWQSSTDRIGFYKVLERLSREIFSKGTKILSLETQELKNGWTVTEFRQQFYFLPHDCEVVSETLIIAHELDNKLDYFRETVISVQIVY